MRSRSAALAACLSLALVALPLVAAEVKARYDANKDAFGGSLLTPTRVRLVAVGPGGGGDGCCRQGRTGQAASAGPATQTAVQRMHAPPNRSAASLSYITLTDAHRMR